MLAIAGGIILGFLGIVAIIRINAKVRDPVWRARRELSERELANNRRAALVVAAIIGAVIVVGMIVGKSEDRREAALKAERCKAQAEGPMPAQDIFSGRIQYWEGDNIVDKPVKPPLSGPWRWDCP